MAFFIIKIEQRFLYWCIALLLVCLSACDSGPQLKPLSRNDVIVAFGDSLTFGTGVARYASYPSVLQGLSGYRVINAGLPGETTAEALTRLPSVLEQHRPKLVILCTGGNDMLRKMSLADAEKHIREMIVHIQASGAEVVLVGVPVPALFSGPPPLYANIAQALSLPYEGKIINEVVKDRDLKSDAVHPNEEGYRLIAERLYDLLKSSGALK